MSIASVDSPVDVISRVTWKRLYNAHQLIRKAQVTEGMREYKALLNTDLARFFYNHLWGITEDQESPSLNWACVCLGEYYLKERVWADWLEMVEFVLPDFSHLSDVCKSRLTFLQGWARLNLPKHSLDQLIENQLHALDTWNISALEYALHSILLGILFRRKRNYQESLRYLHHSIELLLPLQEPFYLLIARDYLAGSYEEFHTYNANFVQTAQTIYAQNAALIDALGASAETEREDYDLGWHYMNANDPTQALPYFERGIQNMRKHSLLFAEKMNQYGKACALIELGHYQESVDLLQDSLCLFWGSGNKYLPTMSSDKHISPLFTGICLYLLGVCFRNLGDIQEAHAKTLLAEKWLSHIEHPLQLSHVKRSLGEIHLHWGESERASVYFSEANRLFEKGSS